MKPNKKPFIAIVAAILAVAICLSFFTEDAPTQENQNNEWDGLVNTVEKKRIAEDFSQQLASPSAIELNIGKEVKELEKKDTEQRAKEGKLLSEISAGMYEYKEDFHSILKRLSNKLLYSEILSNKESGIKELNEIRTNTENIYKELQTIYKTLSTYQITVRGELLKEYESAILVAANYRDFSSEIIAYIDKVTELKTDTTGCLNYINQVHPILLKSFEKLK